MSPPARETYCFSPCVRLSICLSVHHKILWTQHLLSFSRAFLKLCMCFIKVWRCAWRLAVILRLILSLFVRSLNLVIVGLKTYRHWIFCEHSYSYIYTWIFWNAAGVFVKVWKCACFLSAYPQINFCHFICSFNLAQLLLKAYRQSGKLVNATPHTMVPGSFWKFACVFVTWSEDVHVIWLYSSNYFLSQYSQFELNQVWLNFYQNI